MWQTRFIVGENSPSSLNSASGGSGDRQLLGRAVADEGPRGLVRPELLGTLDRLFLAFARLCPAQGGGDLERVVLRCDPVAGLAWLARDRDPPALTHPQRQRFHEVGRVEDRVVQPAALQIATAYRFICNTQQSMAEFFCMIDDR